MDTRSPKRLKLTPERNFAATANPEVANPSSVRAKRAAFLSSISRSISPPAKSRSGASTPQPVSHGTVASQNGGPAQALSSLKEPLAAPKHEIDSPSMNPQSQQTPTAKLMASPFRLTSIRDLPLSKNIDTISLRDILGNPLIKEAWVFNYCFDVDWLMGFFDSDIRDQVKVRIIHGSWRNDDPNKQRIEDACQRWEHVEAAAAYLPDPFGTHHSKMFVLFTHDEYAQVVIHTANMLAQDWTNLTQAAWMSPMLPLLKDTAAPTVGKIGSGSRFKYDLVAYLGSYTSRTKRLREQLALFDFSGVRGALIASVPSTMEEYPTTKNIKALWDQELWGYPSFHRALSSILARDQNTNASHIVCQVSSIATIPQTWLNQFFPVLCGPPPPGSTQQQWDPSHVSIIYPTPTNVASSLNGYASGGSIHTKTQSSAHLKQIDTLRPSLCQWTRGPQAKTRADRDQAAPHIKTYVSFATTPTKDHPAPDVQWALLTSANLSTQAWGTLRDVGKGKQTGKEVVVKSYEIGVLVWPELFADDFDTGENELDPSTRAGAIEERSSMRMIPVFEKDTPLPSPTSLSRRDQESLATQTLVGLRIPYDLPLTPYKTGDIPWSVQGNYDQPDRFGRRWPRDF